MRGILRVVPCADSHKSHRTLVLRQPPAKQMIEDIIGGKLTTVENFTSILHEGESVQCVAFISREQTDTRPNAFANLIWLQSLIRKHGDSWPRITSRSTLTGTVAIFYGDPSFMGSLLDGLLYGRGADGSIAIPGL